MTPKPPGVRIEDEGRTGEDEYVTAWDRYGSFANEKKEPGVLRYNHRPAVLIETHYVTSPVEAFQFRREAVIARFAEAIELGLLNYLAAPEGPPGHDAPAGAPRER